MSAASPIESDQSTRRNTSELVREILDEYGPRIRSTLESYLPDQEPRRWLYDLVADYPRRGGRVMRPTLCLATCSAFGAPTDDALLTAVSIELMHNAGLIHDDIEDESSERRGSPTLHELHGVPLALNAGDALMFRSLRPLIDNRHRLGGQLTLRVLEELEQITAHLCEGQGIELGWLRDNRLDITTADYLDLVLKKTCWFTIIHPIRMGALIGTRDNIDLDRFTRFGFFLGAVFQIQDDLLNLVGDHTDYGKELDGDIFEGKRTLMLIRLLEMATPAEAARLGDLFVKPRSERSQSEVRWVRDRMDHYGCIEYGRTIAHALAGAARNEFKIAFAGVPASRDLDFIEGLITWVIKRS